jgi:hypothetical protein
MITDPQKQREMKSTADRIKASLLLKPKDLVRITGK